MPTASLRRRRGPNPDRRRALELLASCLDGCTEAMMLAHGFTIDDMVGLVRAGLATATTEHVIAGSRKLEVARVRITDNGRHFAGGSAQMTAPVVFEIQSVADLEHITDSVGKVGPRTGRAKRTKEQMEWFVLSRFLEKAISDGIFKLPIAGRNGSGAREEPDFVLMRAGTNDLIALVEITEATNEADQREMTAFERSGERMALLGHSGGRFPRGAARPGLAWASDIIDAIKRKETKVIFKSSLTPRHLIIYPNSNASKLLGDQPDQEGKNEREAIGHLRQAIDNAGNLARVTNGCHVHVLGMRHICVDVVGDMKILHR